MTFFQRNREELLRRGIAAERIPPGQYSTERFPVLHTGDVPEVDRRTWTFRVFGLVENEVTLSWEQFQALPHVERVFDIHCVTKWSKYDTRWGGVLFTDILALARPLPEARYVLEHAEYGYTTNAPLSDLMRPYVLLADSYDGQPLEPIHGGPVRMVVPHLYFWKSAKWIRGVELLAHDRPGFWEQNGYHMYGDPFREQRYTND